MVTVSLTNKLAPITLSRSTPKKFPSERLRFRADCLPARANGVTPLYRPAPSKKQRSSPSVNMNATVKRKFNALVQGIGNSSSSSLDKENSNHDSAALMSSPLSMRSTPNLSSSLANDELLNKKRRVGGATPTPTSRFGTPNRFGTPPTRSIAAAADGGGDNAPSPVGSIRVTGGQTGTTTSVSNITLRKYGGSSGAAAHPPSIREGGGLPPPKYCPGDREQLLRRLATFQELTDWTPKPDRVNEVEWAKRGWVCQGKERVKCTLCNAELVVKINRKEVDGKEISVLIASEIEESVVGRYAQLVVESHGEDCLWRRKGCDGMSSLSSFFFLSRFCP